MEFQEMKSMGSKRLGAVACPFESLRSSLDVSRLAGEIVNLSDICVLARGQCVLPSI